MNGVSFLVANYNQEKYILECLESIGSINWPLIEIVLVDDASEDESYSLAVEFLEGRGLRFKNHRNDTNKGVAFTKDRCIELASFEFVAFVDPDDMVEADCLQALIPPFLDAPDASLIYSRMKIFGGEIDGFIENKRVGPPSQMDYLLEPRHQNRISALVLFRKSKYQASGGLGLTYKRGIDQDLYYKLSEVGGIKFVDRHTYKYRVHRGGISTMSNTFRALYWHYLIRSDASSRRVRQGKQGLTETELREEYEMVQRERLKSRRLNLRHLAHFMLAKHPHTFSMRQKLRILRQSFDQ